jgi:peptidoglycan/LPS O-acetylase OafA/YrhL
MPERTESGQIGISPKTARYSHIDALRALAVMLVVVAHAGLGDIVPGGSGVTIFFAVSGFIITHLIVRERETSGGFRIKDFYIRRALKIAPPFLVILVLPTLIYSMFATIEWRNFFSQVFFVFNWVYMQREDPKVLPGSGVVWSLSIEEQFYILFALFWLLAVRSKSYLNIVATLAIGGIIASTTLRFYFVATMDVPHFRVYYGTDTRLDAIAIGVLSAVLYAKWSRSPNPSRLQKSLTSDWIPLLSALMYLSSLLIRDEGFRETLRYSLQAVAASIFILYGLLCTNTRFRRAIGRLVSMKFIQIIGLASYSIYLVHLQLDKLLIAVIPDWPIALSFTVRVASGIAVGLLVWFAVEKPVERFKHSYFLRAGASRDLSETGDGPGLSNTSGETGDDSTPRRLGSL